MEEEQKTAETDGTKAEIPNEKKKSGAGKVFEKIKAVERGFLHDFKAFISKGNIIQLAVAFIMGAAFTAIVNSLVGDIFMPVFSLIFGKTDIGTLQWVVSPDLTIKYGSFILAVLNFLLISLVLFLIVKAAATAESGIKKLKKGKNGEPVPAPAPAPVPLSKTEELLTEIKELLKAQKTAIDG